jgi:hypothetical protein
VLVALTLSTLDATRLVVDALRAKKFVDDALSTTRLAINALLVVLFVTKRSPTVASVDVLM